MQMQTSNGLVATVCGVLCVVLALFLLSGCASDGSVSLSSLPIGDEAVTKLSGNITDASTIKETVVHQSLQNRDRAYTKAHKESGFRVKFKMEQVSPGVYVQVMEDVSFREAPRFEQPLPTAPSEHPLWKTLDRLGGKAMDTVLWWKGIAEVADVQKHSLDAAQTKYFGDYNPQTAAPYIVEPTVVTVPQ